MKNVLFMITAAVAITACAKYIPPTPAPNMGFTTNGTTTLTYKEFSDPEFGVGCGEAPYTRKECTHDSTQDAPNIQIDGKER